jgi:hypothetical protein
MQCPQFASGAKTAFAEKYQLLTWTQVRRIKQEQDKAWHLCLHFVLVLEEGQEQSITRLVMTRG